MKSLKQILLGTLLTGAIASAATLVTVNGEKISSDEVNKILLEGTQGQFFSLPPEKQQELKQRVITGLVNQKLIYTNAVKTGILKTKEYKEELDDVLDRIKQQIAMKVWEEKQLESIKISEKEMKAYFDNNPQEFMQTPKVRARHILVKTEEEAKKLISEMKSLKGSALKDKFIELAKTNSTGPSAPKGGDLGFFGKGQMVPEFEDAAFNMDVSTITKNPIKTQFGYHIIYVDEKQSGKVMSFDEAKNFIEKKLRLEKYKELITKKMKALHESAKIVYSK